MAMLSRRRRFYIFAIALVSFYVFLKINFYQIRINAKESSQNFSSLSTNSVSTFFNYSYLTIVYTSI